MGVTIAEIDYGHRGVEMPYIRKLFRRGPAGLCTAAAVALTLVGCDLSVTNPGPVQDRFLNDPGAFDAILMGALRNNARGLTRLAYDTEIVAGAVVAGGLQDTRLIQGELTSDNQDGNWQLMHRGRWVSEDGVRRVREVLGSEFGQSEVGADLLIQAAYANRILGENMCVAVIDGGPAQDHTVHFERAETQFTEALQIARDLGNRDQELAALAGRATARIWLDDWAGAMEDAGAVPDDFAFLMEYFDLDLQFGDANKFRFRQAGIPWYAWTVWDTFAEDYYLATGDPRMAWTTDPETPFTMVYEHPFYIQLKFPELTSPHTLASGREMRLLEAEYALRQNRMADAMDLINGVRTTVISDDTGQPLEPRVASTIPEAWTALKEERRIEMWLEGRRLPALRRWTADGTPGQMEDMSGRSLCVPVGTTEVDTNPNDLPEVN